MKDTKYGIDHILVRNSRIFGFGWIFHTQYLINSIVLELTLSDGAVESLPVAYSKQRDDVHDHYPECAHSLYSGFVVYGGWNSRESLNSVDLVVVLSGGCGFKVNVPYAEFSSTDNHTSVPTVPYRLLLQRAWSHLRKGEIRLLLHKAKRYRYGVSIKQASISDILNEKIKQSVCKHFILVLDHDLGGGANHYRERFVKKQNREDVGVALLTYHLLSLQYVVDISTGRCEKRRFGISGLDVIIDLAEEGLITEVFYNNAVSFECPEDVPDLLVILKKVYGLKLTFAIHDYFPICPSHLLLDSGGQYCDIPDEDKCNLCLPENKYRFVTLYQPNDIRLWREKWGACLNCADTILCFSNASRSLVKKAYPEVMDDRIYVVPHTVDYLPGRKPRIDVGRTIHIGVVGEISYHKGSAVIQGLAEEIRKRRLNIKISIIGLMEGNRDTNIVNEKGAFEHSELVNEIEDSNANIFLFPSVWPETFSYVVQELMFLDLPVACFDLGAPAERVREYEKGWVIPLGDSGAILDNIISFHRSLRGHVREVN